VRPVERVLEVAKALAERSTSLGKALGPKHYKRDHKDDQQMGWLKDVCKHAA